MDESYKEVEFEKYCKTCKHEKKDEKFDPCCECLEQGMNEGTVKPICWEEKEE